MKAAPKRSVLTEALYNRITGDEDARVCKDIPEDACNDQPHNFFAVMNQWKWVVNPYGMSGVFLILNVMHGGVRLGRKVYLVDMATGENRAAYVAISNTVIGVLMLLGRPHRADRRLAGCSGNRAGAGNFITGGCALY